MTLAPGGISLIPVTGLGEVQPGDSLAEILLEALRGARQPLVNGDIVVVTQKIVSKAEDRLVDPETITPSDLACRWAAAWAKDPPQVELVLRESHRLVRMERGIIISETPQGLVCANAGVDASNIPGGKLALLPVDADASAAAIRATLQAATGVQLGVVISDTFGRPWRVGQVNVAIGSAGVQALRQYQGQRDPYGYELRVTEIAIADELASAAELVMGKTDGVPVVIVRGLAHLVGETEQTSAVLVRAPGLDLFR